MAKRGAKKRAKARQRIEIERPAPRIGVNWRLLLPALSAVAVTIFAIVMTQRPASRPEADERPRVDLAETDPADGVANLDPPPAGVSPAAAEAKFNEGAMLANAGQLERAIAAFQEALRLDPASLETRANIGRAQLQLGRFDDAVASYREVIRRNPDDAMAHDMLGVAYGFNGNMEAALEEFQKAIRLDPGLASAYNNAGLAYMKRSDTARAAVMFEEAIAADPAMTKAYGNLARLYMDTGRPELVEPLMQKLRAANPNDPMADQVLSELAGPAAGSESSTPTPHRD
jgi:tetratricopeptide (TPR) repeat protein